MVLNDLLGILLIALRGLSTRIVLIAERFKFCVSTAYSMALNNKPEEAAHIGKQSAN